MFLISIADIYYKIEDKWFDLLDWLEAHSIPVYKIIDPLEKRGIPSLPVFVALSLILLYLIFGVLLAGGGPLVCFEDDKGDAVANADFKILQDDEIVYNGVTGSDGCAPISLADGDYEAMLDKTGYDKNKHSFSITEDKKSAKITVKHGNATMTAKTFCLQPDDAGDVSAYIKDNNNVPQDIVECGTSSSCSLSIEQGMTYVFASDTHISDTYTYNELNGREADECIGLEIITQDEPETGFFTVVVKDNQSRDIEGAEVHLVSISDTNTDILPSLFTDDQGKAAFEGEIGATFKIYVPAPAGLAVRSFLSSQTFTFESIANSYTVILGSATSFISITVNDGLDPVAGVAVTVFSSMENDRVYYTHSDGKVNFSAIDGREYNVTLYKEQFEYKEQAMVGGRSYTVSLNRILESRTGSIEARVIRSDTKDTISGAAFDLWKKSGDGWTPTGYPATPTSTGNNGLGYFGWVLPGSYCVIATPPSPARPNTCDTGGVEVTANTRSYITIEIAPANFRLTVTVLDANDDPVEGANVIIWNKKGTTRINSSQTNTNGMSELKVVGDTVFLLEVLYTDDNDEKFRTREYIGPFNRDAQWTVRLEHINTSIQFEGIFDAIGNEVNHETAPLMAGAKYNFKFGFGLPNMSGKRWDSIETSFSLNPDYALFSKDICILIDPRGSLNCSISNDNVESATKTIRISGYDVEFSGTTVHWSLPAKIKGQSNDQVYPTNVGYKATWKQGTFDVKDPLNGNPRYEPFSVQNSSTILPPPPIVRPDDHVFLITLTIKNSTHEVDGSDNSFKSPIFTTFTLKANITNNGTKDYYGTINLTQVTYMVNFLDVVAINGDIRYGTSLIDKAKAATITVPDAAPLTLKPGQSLLIEANVYPVNTSTGTVYLFINSPTYTTPTRDAAFVFSIQGDGAGAIAITTPTSAQRSGEINEFTPTMYFHIKNLQDNAIVLWQYISSISLSGSALQDGVTCAYSSSPQHPGDNTIRQETPVNGNFSVDFVDDCPLKGAGDLTVSVTAVSSKYVVDPLSLSVISCFPGSGVTRKDVKVGQKEDISVKLDTSNCRESNMVYEKAWGEKTCSDTVCSFISSNDAVLDPTNLAFKSSPNSFNVSPLYFLYDTSEIIPAFGIEENASVSFTVHSMKNKQDRQIKKNRSVAFTFNITSPSPAELCGNGDLDQGEECEVNDDCPSGETCASCMCQGGGTGGGVFSGRFFWPLPTQKYDKTLACEKNYCTTEQVLQWISSKLASPDSIDCSNHAGFTTKTFEFNVVDQPWLYNDVAALAKIIYGLTFAGTMNTEPTGWTSDSKYLVIKGSAPAGYNKVVIKKGGVAGSTVRCYTSLEFIHVRDVIDTRKIENIQLYLPANKTSLASTLTTLPKVFTTSISSNQRSLLNTTLSSQWGLSQYLPGGGDADPYDHHIEARIDTSLGTGGKPNAIISVERDGKKISFAASSPAWMDILIKSFRAYADPNDAYKIDGDTTYFLVVPDTDTEGLTLVLGSNEFPVNMSEGSIAANTALRDLIITKIQSELSINAVTSIVNGRMDESYAVVAIGNSRKVSPYVGLFNDLANNPNVRIPEKGIGWFMERGNYLFAPDAGVAANLLRVLARSTPTSGTYSRISDNLVAEYESKTMNELSSFILDKFTSMGANEVYTTIVMATAGTGDCKVNLASKSIYLNLDGTLTQWTPSFGNNGIYLVTMNKTPTSNITYAKTLLPGTQPAGVACGEIQPGCSNACLPDQIQKLFPDCSCVTPVIPILPLDLVFLGDEGVDRTVNLYNYSAQADLSTISDNTKNSKTRTRLDIPDAAEVKLKVADIDGDGKSEIIVFDSDGTDKKLSVLNQSKGAINLTAGDLNWKTSINKSFTFKSLNYIDFAVFSINGESALAMLENKDGKNDIWVYKYSSIANGASIDSTYNSNNKITQLDINDKDFNSVKAAIIDGVTKLLAFESRRGGGSNHQTWVGIYAVEGTVSFGAGYKDWNNQHTQYFQFYASDDCSLADGCRDIDFIDWDSSGSTELACLNEDPIALSDNAENNILLYTVSSLKNTGGDIDLCKKETYRSDIDTDNIQAEKLYVADINGDGKLEIIQADLTGDPSDSLIVYGNKIASSIGEDPDDEQLKDKTIYMTNMPYIDMAVYDWTYDRGKKVA